MPLEMGGGEGVGKGWGRRGEGVKDGMKGEEGAIFLGDHARGH